MNEITIYDKLGETALASVEMMGKAMAASGMFGITKVEQGIVLALTSLMERKSVTELARKFHIIEGRLTMRADAMQAEFQAGGGRIIWAKSDEKECEAIFCHQTYCPDGVTVRVTLQELEKSGVAVGRSGLKDNYRKFPRQMLRARVISEGVRMVDPSVIVGVYTPEEVSDFKEYQPETRKQPVELLAVAEKKSIESAEKAYAKELEELIPASLWGDAEKYLQSIDWLAAGQSLSDVKPGHVLQIQNNLERFMQAIRPVEADNA